MQKLWDIDANSLLNLEIFIKITSAIPIEKEVSAMDSSY